MTLHSGRSLNVAVRTDDSDSEDALGLITPSSDDDDEQAAQHFRSKVDESLKTLMTKINWTAHIVAHS